MNICPCCGQAAEAGGMLVDDASGIIAVNGKFARLTFQQMALFAALKAAWPRGRSKQELMTDLYWLRSEHEEPLEKIIDVWVCKIRKQITPLGLQIETLWGKGYRLRLESQSALPIHGRAA